MIENRSVPSNILFAHVVYEDVGAAIAWLCRTFGFVEHYRYGEPGGAVSGAQMHLGGRVDHAAGDAGGAVDSGKNWVLDAEPNGVCRGR